MKRRGLLLALVACMCMNSTACDTVTNNSTTKDEFEKTTVSKDVETPAEDTTTEAASKDNASTVEKDTVPMSVELGQTVIMGSYEQDNDYSNGAEPIEWEVIAIKEGKAQLLSKKVLFYDKFTDDYSTRPMWTEASIRNKLNADFYMSAFSELERSRIASTLHNVKDITPETGEYREISCTDYVMLMNENEIPRATLRWDGENCFTEYLCEPTVYAMVSWAKENLEGMGEETDTEVCCNAFKERSGLWQEILKGQLDIAHVTNLELYNMVGTYWTPWSLDSTYNDGMLNGIVGHYGYVVREDSFKDAGIRPMLWIGVDNKEDQGMSFYENSQVVKVFDRMDPEYGTLDAMDGLLSSQPFWVYDTYVYENKNEDTNFFANNLVRFSIENRTGKEIDKVVIVYAVFDAEGKLLYVKNLGDKTEQPMAVFTADWKDVENLRGGYSANVVGYDKPCYANAIVVSTIDVDGNVWKNPLTLPWSLQIWSNYAFPNEEMSTFYRYKGRNMADLRGSLSAREEFHGDGVKEYTPDELQRFANNALTGASFIKLDYNKAGVGHEAKAYRLSDGSVLCKFQDARSGFGGIFYRYIYLNKNGVWSLPASTMDLTYETFSMEEEEWTVYEYEGHPVVLAASCRGEFVFYYNYYILIDGKWQDLAGYGCGGYMNDELLLSESVNQNIAPDTTYKEVKEKLEKLTDEIGTYFINNGAAPE